MKPKSPFEFTAGNLCLNFANTIDNRGSDHPKELLNGYSDLLRWSEEAGTIKSRVAEPLSRLAAEIPGHAKSTLRQAVQLRDAIYAVFSAVAQRHGVPSSSVAVLNQAVQQASTHTRLVHANRHFAWEWIMREENLDSVLWPVARAAAELLTSEDLAKVRLCASTDCSWLFLDKTKNHRRRWCEMKTCGNRDKARRYYQRQKSA